MRNENMKMLLGTVALVTLVTSSAFAHQTPQPRLSSAYAQSPANTHLGAPHISGNAVYAEGRIIGQDPDPNVRLQLQRDFGSWNW
jgi:hypothetical protein